MGGYPFSLEPLDYFIVLRHFSKGITIIMHTIALLLASASEPNRAKPPPMKGVSFRRANHAELTFPPWGKFCGLGGGRIFWPKAGISVRLSRSNDSFSLAVLTLFWK